MLKALTDRNRHGGYQPLARLSLEESSDPKNILYLTERTKQQIRGNRFYISLLTILLVVSGFVITWKIWPVESSTLTTCTAPRRRKEWRALEPSEQQQYIDGVLCLMRKPSISTTGSTRYDDFASLHATVGPMTHYAASFLPWHRYFTHTFEKALAEECRFSGTLVYWDWTLDASNFTASPIWNSDTGFGGNGDPNLEPQMPRGNCVVDGPFANTTRTWQSDSNGHGFNLRHSPHCLSRGFLTGEKAEQLQSRVSPAALQRLLGQSSYGKLLDEVEIQTHNVIPQFVRGDFYRMTAPNDPVFYLHHTQVDRLWWLWQQQDLEARINQYEGPKNNMRIFKNMTQVDASLEDIVEMGGFADDILVRDLMSTQSDLLCYSY